MPGTPKILVIDDEVAILRLLRTVFARVNYEVSSAESATEALSLLDRAQFDCIITDAVMPEMSGFDFVKAVRANSRFADLPILMLTRKRHREDVKKAVEAGVTDYILKPIDEDLLLEKVQFCVKKGGKAFSRELPLSGVQGEAEVGVPCQIISLGEDSLTLRLHQRLDAQFPFQLRSTIFAEMGIAQPHLKLESCEMKATTEPDSQYSWEAKVSYERMPESDCNKVREWTSRQALQRKRAAPQS